MARVARATAIIYAGLTVPFAYLAWTSGVSDGEYNARPPELIDQHGEWTSSYDVSAYGSLRDQPITEVELPDGRVLRVVAPTDDAAAAGVKAWLREHPTADRQRDGGNKLAQFLLWWAAAYVGFWALFRGVRWILNGFFPPASAAAP